MNHLIFYQLPDMLKQCVLEFSCDGPFCLTYDYKTKSFIRKINRNYLILNKANQFKIDNPPEFYIEGPFDEDEYHEQTITLTFKFPLKLAENKRDYELSHEENLILTFIYTIDLLYDETYKCSIVIPMYYHRLNGEGRIYIENKFKGVDEERYICSINSFNKRTYGYDIEIC